MYNKLYITRDVDSIFQLEHTIFPVHKSHLQFPIIPMVSKSKQFTVFLFFDGIVSLQSILCDSAW